MSEEKDATLKLQLKSKSGYTSKVECAINANQWFAINQIIEGKGQVTVVNDTTWNGSTYTNEPIAVFFSEKQAEITVNSINKSPQRIKEGELVSTELVDLDISFDLDKKIN